MAQLSDFMLSKVRVKLIELFFQDPDEMWYVRELTRLTGEEINAVRRELSRMQEVGMVKSEERGNRLYYMLSPQYEFFVELLTLVAKTSGLGKDIKKNRKKLGELTFVMFSGKFARKSKKRMHTDVDILVVGNVVLPEMAAIVKGEEVKRGYEINYTVISPEEFDFRKNRRDPFLREILASSRVMIIGDEDSLLELKPQLATS